ncbi:extensin family protein [Mesorhizobium sp. M4B.F.Ca.ET.013.02.1.1]|nr:extensin family protein [Mesorhizobium sp. M4B.F.Ca.ET.013.02.1.1]
MATLSISGFFRLALPLAAAVFLITPADARHRHRQPLTPRLEQPLTQRADQPLRPRSKHRVRSRGKRHIASELTQHQTQDQPTLPADVSVPEPRPAEAQQTDAATKEERKAAGPRDADASDRIDQDKSPQEERQRPEPSAPEPSTEMETQPEAPAAAPIPTQRPDKAEPEVEPPAVAPKPPEKPAESGDNKPPPDPRSAILPEQQMPEEELACRRRLTSMGVDFEEHKAEQEPEIGCSIPYPIVLKTLGKSMAISPGAELNCAMAEAAARFTAEIIQPAVEAKFGTKLKSIGQASAFVCRARHNGGKMSEHAFGNALDIASFTLADGRKIEVGPAPPEQDAQFLGTVRKAACGPFKTVLGPGSDADHSLHFHLDLEPRRHGGTFCQ